MSLKHPVHRHRRKLDSKRIMAGWWLTTLIQSPSLGVSSSQSRYCSYIDLAVQIRNECVNKSINNSENSRTNSTGIVKRYTSQSWRTGGSKGVRCAADERRQRERHSCTVVKGSSANKVPAFPANQDVLYVIQMLATSARNFNDDVASLIRLVLFVCGQFCCFIAQSSNAGGISTPSSTVIVS